MKMEGGRKEEQAMKKLRELLVEETNPDVGVEVMSMDGGRRSRVTQGQSRPSVLLYNIFEEAQNFQLVISGLAKMNLEDIFTLKSGIFSSLEDLQHFLGRVITRLRGRK